MSMIQGLIDYILQCPFVKAVRIADISADWTGETPENMAVAATNSSVMKQYMDGSAQMESNYVMLLKSYLGENQQRLEYNEFLENLSRWFLQQNAKRLFPDVGEGKKVSKISAANAMLWQVEEDQSGIYQVQIKLIYTQKGGR